jgi:hypothetical protein
MSGDDHGSEVAIHGGFVTGMAGASGAAEVPDRAERGGPSFLQRRCGVQIRFRWRTKRFGDQAVRFRRFSWMIMTSGCGVAQHCTAELGLLTEAGLTRIGHCPNRPITLVSNAVALRTPAVAIACAAAACILR